MILLDHISIPVNTVTVSRDWCTENLGLRIEFEIPERNTVALIDDGDTTLFLYEDSTSPIHPECALTFQVDSVDEEYAKLTAAGIVFENPPQKLFWGYGAELRDPDGYLIRLWDEKTGWRKAMHDWETSR